LIVRNERGLREAGSTDQRLPNSAMHAVGVEVPLLGLRAEVDAAYRDWCCAVDLLAANESSNSAKLAPNRSGPRFFLVIITNGGDQAAVDETIKSIASQSIWQVGWIQVDLHDQEGLTRVRGELARGTREWNKSHWVLFLNSGDRLTPSAFASLRRKIDRHPEAVAVYFDDDSLDGEGLRSQPRFKPDWSLVHYHSLDFVGQSVVLRADALIDAAEVFFPLRRGVLFDLMLRIAEKSEHDRRLIQHLPRVLRNRRGQEVLTSPLPEQRELSLAEHFQRMGRRATFSFPGSEVCRVHYEVPPTVPLVSIIIPTRDASTLIRKCVDSLLTRTLYPRIELLIVDNRSSEREAVNYLESLPARSTDRISIRVLHYDRDFNYSDLNNRAVEIARGELICLLNNDTEVISPDWLHEMVGHVIQPGVGAVGAKLLYGNGRVQHAGDVVGYGGCANHLHAGIEGTDPGYCLRAAVAQELSAVTGACLLTPRSIYTQIGGLDATFLRVTFNDVDFCLRLRKNGYKVIWTPYALLYHHESATRGRPKGLLARLRAKLEARVMRLRWAGTLRQDPFYNPNMARRRSDFTLAAPAAILRVASDAAGRRVAAST